MIKKHEKMISILEVIEYLSQEVQKLEQQQETLPCDEEGIYPSFYWKLEHRIIIKNRAKARLQLYYNNKLNELKSC